MVLKSIKYNHKFMSKDIIWSKENRQYSVEMPRLSTDVLETIISKKVVIWRNSFLIFTIAVILMTCLLILSGFLIGSFYDLHNNSNSSSVVNDHEANTMVHVNAGKKYVVRFGSFSTKAVAENFKAKVLNFYAGEVFVIKKDDIFHVVSTEFENYQAAESIMSAYYNIDGIYGAIESV